MNQPRGPRQEVSECERVGAHGAVRWALRLACGHTKFHGRKVEIGNSVSCPECVLREAPLSFHDHSLRTQALVANHLKVSLESVQVVPGGVSVFLDVDTIKRLLDRDISVEGEDMFGFVPNIVAEPPTIL